MNSQNMTPQHTGKQLAIETPLVGQHLIEASAGTGKTYTIALLYLRALLGVGTDKQRCLTVAQILVVTFTNAATEELSARIRQRIVDALLQVQGLLEKPDPVVQLVLEATTLPTDEVIKTLRLALAQIDLANISTIHSFAGRLVRQAAFSGGMPLGLAMNIADDVYDQPLKDYWRTHAARLLEDGSYPTFRDMKKSVSGLLKRGNIILHSTTLSPDFFSAYNRDEIKAFYEAHKTVFADYGNIKSATVTAALKAIDAFLEEKKPLLLKHVQLFAFDQLQLMFQSMSASTSRFVLSAEQHPLFVECQTMVGLYGAEGSLPHRDAVNVQAGMATLSDIAAYVKEKIAAAEKESVNVSADRILLLAESSITPEMAGFIRQQYPLAMIDEFQDTDSAQYSLFSKVYKNSNTTGFLMIGDPKQAIYSFRGGDVHAYLQARDDADNTFTMDANFRSTEAIVKGVNAIFGHVKDKPPLLTDAVGFMPVSAASGKAPVRVAPVKGQWQTLEAYTVFYDAANADCDLGMETLRRNAATATANYIEKLLYLSFSGQCLIPDKQGVSGQTDRPVAPADIAILVRSAAEGLLVKNALDDRGIASVYRSRESLFLQPEAQDVWHVLQAVFYSTSEAGLYASLLCQSMAYSLVDVQQMLLDDEKKQWLSSQFSDAGKILEKSGPLPAILYLLNALDRPAAMMQKIGDRGLTNYLHLLEALQERYQVMGGGFQLLQWLGDAVSNTEDIEEKLVRLESDARRVQIVTIHGAKGLEYPVVLLPFTWVGSSAPQKSPYIYHNEYGQLAASLTDFDKNRSKKEDDEEALRLFYVAVTRASHHTWFYLTDHHNPRKKRENTGPGDFFNQSVFGYYFGTADISDSVEVACQSFIKALLDITLESPEQKVYGETLLSIIVPPDWHIPPENIALVRDALVFDTAVKRNIGLTSFTSMARGYSSVLKDNDQDEISPDVMAATIKNNHRFSLARGAHVGTALHKVLEFVPFPKFGPDYLPVLSARVKASLLEYGVISMKGDNTEEVARYTQWMQEVIATPFHQLACREQQGEPFALENLREWKTELDFHLRLGSRFNTRRLNTVLAKYGKSLPNLAYTEITGFLRGSIDLVFSEGGKFYLADYKSSWLGDTFSAYEETALDKKNHESAYVLQYLIYTIALHRYLKHRLGERYGYAEHFGGVYYLYLRGMHKDHPGKGVFHELPEAALIDELDKLFDESSSYVVHDHE